MTTANENTTVLVTGASGFVGIHCVQQLLDEGYKVRGTVRNCKNELKIKPLKALKGAQNLELVEADLESDDGWMSALNGCIYVLHVASPFPILTDASIIDTAVDGTLRVLQAAAKTPTIKKVVVTSSCAAIHEGHKDSTKVFTEDDWTDVQAKGVLLYSQSKTLAEKAAWDFVEKENVNFKLTTINPTLVVGPLLHDVQGTSISIIRRYLSGEMPAVPNVYFGLVDVRDVAHAHIAAMRCAESDGLRILVTHQPSFSFMDIANVLRKEFASQGYRLPRFTVPFPVLWIYSFVDREASQLLNRVGDAIKFDNSRAKRVLGMTFIDPKESLIAMAYDIIERGMVPKKKGFRPRDSQSKNSQS